MAAWCLVIGIAIGRLFVCHRLFICSKSWAIEWPMPLLPPAVPSARGLLAHRPPVPLLLSLLLCTQAPLAAIVLFGAALLCQLLYGVATFRTVPEEAELLQKVGSCTGYVWRWLARECKSCSVGNQLALPGGLPGAWRRVCSGIVCTIPQLVAWPVHSTGRLPCACRTLCGPRRSLPGRASSTRPAAAPSSGLHRHLTAGLVRGTRQTTCEATLVTAQRPQPASSAVG